MKEDAGALHRSVVLMSDREGDDLGDAIQSKAIKNLLSPLGVRFAYCPKYGINDYSGDPAFVVMNGEFSRGRMDCTWGELMRSTPLLKRVWFGFSINPSDYGTFVSEGGVECLRGEGTIGVRDSGTASFLIGEGVDAVVTGCASMLGYRSTVPRAASCAVGVDVSDGELEAGMMSFGLRGNGIRKVSLTHSGKLLGESWEDIENSAETVVVGLLNDAAVVVSGRVHAILPLLGSDVPIVFSEAPDGSVASGAEFCYMASVRASHLVRRAICGMSRSLFRVMVEDVVAKEGSVSL